MARLSEEKTKKILADFHTGVYSLRELAKMHDVSHTTIGKITKGLSPQNKENVATLVRIKSDLAGQSCQNVASVERVVDDMVKKQQYFEDSVMKNQKMANDFLNGVSSLSEIETHARITAKNKETVFGRMPDVMINNQNQQNNKDELKIVVQRNTLNAIKQG